MENHPRSKLITRVGQLFLLGSTALLAITISQLLVLSDAIGSEPTPRAHYPGTQEAAILIAGQLLLYASTLLVSFALLKRFHWARPAFIAILVLGIALNVVKLIWSYFATDGNEPLPTDGPAPYLFI